MARKIRVDQWMVHQGIVENVDKARRLIMAGKVRRGDEIVVNPSQKMNPEDVLSVDTSSRFVSRGGDKLQSALDAFSVDVDGKICADVGTSTGGFTDCLLKYGARKIYAIDVAYGQLDWRLRHHHRVVVIERTNVRFLKSLPDPIELITIDVSFISLKLVLPVVLNWFSPAGGVALILIKPQFEATRKEAARGSGVIRDSGVHQRILKEILIGAQELGFQVSNLIRSPLVGPDGNVEFFAKLEAFPGQTQAVELDSLIASLF